MKDAMDTLDGMIPEGAKPREPRGVWWYRFAVLLLLLLAVIGTSLALFWSDHRFVNEDEAEAVIHAVGDRRYLTIAAAQQQMVEIKSGQTSIAAGVDQKLNSMQTDIREIRNILLQQAYPRREQQ